MAIQEREADLVIASFGRAIWVLDNIRPLRELARNKGVSSPNKRITAYPIGDVIQAEIRNAPGYEWSTWGTWDAPNRDQGAPLSFYVNYLPGDTSKKMKLDSVTARIYNDKNEQIRQLKWKVDTGFNRKNWGLEQKGYRFPGSPKPKNEEQEPSGLQVLPGNYKIVYALGDGKDSAMVTIKADPRLGERNNIRVSQYAMFGRLQKSSDKLTLGLDRLTEAEDLTKKMDAQLKDVEGKPADSLRKATRIIQDSIKAVRESITGKRFERQGYGQVPQVTITNQLQTARAYIGAKTLTPGPQEELLVKRAEEMVDGGVNRINAFFDGPWKNYRQLAESTKLDLFKDYPPIK
jgi:hypothetical protein